MNSLVNLLKESEINRFMFKNLFTNYLCLARSSLLKKWEKSFQNWSTSI